VAGEQQGDLVRRLRAVVEAKDAEIGVLRGERELWRRLELRLAEVERRLSMDSPDSGTPPSKERIGAKEARRRGSSRSGNAVRIAGGAGSQGTRGKAWPGTRTRARRRMRSRRRSAAAAMPGWTARRLRRRGGRRSSTCRSPGR
jgi:hypothetical protein